MACSLRKRIQLSDIVKVRQSLQPGQLLPTEQNLDEDYDNRWAWHDDEDDSTADNSEVNRNSLIGHQDQKSQVDNGQDCLISVSPLATHVALAKQMCLVICKSTQEKKQSLHQHPKHRKQDTKKEDEAEGETVDEDLQTSSQFDVIYSTTLTKHCEHEQITSLVASSFIFQPKSNTGSPDFNCFLVGFNTGFLRIYTEKGLQVFEQQFVNECVKEIKIRTFFSKILSRRSLDEQNELEFGDQLCLVYDHCLVTVDGNTFSNTLKANLIEIQSVGKMNFNLSGHVEFHRWNFPSSFSVTNKCNSVGDLGTKKISDFDYLVGQSLRNGPDFCAQKNGHDCNFFLTVGSDPFYSLLRANVEKRLPTFNDIAETTISSVKNFIPFLKNKKEERPKLERIHQLHARLSLNDSGREALNVVVCSDRSLALVSDSFGRVWLLDVVNNNFIRVWKGYRNCECAFIEVAEHRMKSIDSSDHRRERGTNSSLLKRSLFVCLHAPRRKILEIWPAKFGPRISAFNVGKRCRLITIDHHMLGFGFASMKKYLENHCRSLNIDPFTSNTYLIDLEDFSFYSIEIPFVCSIIDQCSSRFKDSLLLKQFPQLFQTNENYNADKVLALFGKAQLLDSKIQLLNFLIKESNVDLLQKCVQSLKQELKVKLEAKLEAKLDNQSKFMQYHQIVSLYERCQRIDQLIHVYNELVRHNQDTSIRLEKNIIRESPGDVDVESSKIQWKPVDFTRIISLFSYGESLNPDGYELEIKVPSFSSFMEFFDLESPANYFGVVPKKVEQLRKQTSVCILMRTDHCGEEQLQQLGNFLFTRNLVLGTDNQILETLLSNGLCSFSLLQTLFCTWLSNFYAVNWKTWNHLHFMASTIIEFVSKSKKWTERDHPHHHYSKYGRLLLHLKKVCKTIVNSKYSCSAIVAAYTVQVISKQHSPEDFDSSSEDDVNKDQDKDAVKEEAKKEDEEEEEEEDPDEEWETLSLEQERFSLILKQLEDTYLLNLLLHLQRTTLTKDLPLSYLLKEKPGIVSELIAKWCVENEVIPELKRHEDCLDEMVHHLPDRYQLNLGEDSIPIVYNEDNDQVQQLLQHVQMRFPYSLEPDVLLANCAWDSIVQFNKDCSVSNALYLQHCVNYLNRIGSPVLKHNIACMMWNTFFVNKFSILCELLEESGKLPSEQDCQTVLSIGLGCLEMMVNFLCELMEFILNTIYNEATEQRPVYHIDEWWKNAYSETDEWKQLLVSIALAQSTARASIVFEHCHLLFVISMLVNFQLKGFRPLSMFPSYVRQSFFKELQLQLADYREDDNVIEWRQKFAYDSARAIARTVPVVQVGFPDEIERKSYSQATSWLSKLLTVCREWNLDIDVVRRKFIHRLYEYESCVFADELFNTVSHPELLAKELLVLAGIRLINLIGDQFSIELIKIRSPASFWLKKKREEYRSKLKRVPDSKYEMCFETTRNLIQNIYDRLDENEDHSKIAGLMLEYMRTNKIRK